MLRLQDIIVYLNIVQYPSKHLCRHIYYFNGLQINVVPTQLCEMLSLYSN